MRETGWFRACAAAGFAAVWALAAGCTTNAATGRSQLNLLSRSELVAMGESSKDELAGEYGGAFADAGVQAYVSEVGMKLKEHTEGSAPGLPWEFTVLDSEVINAFALPGGKVFMTRGLASRLTNEAQLASVLGHEIGHVTANHVGERMNRQLALAGGAAVIGALASGSENSRAALGAQLLISGAGVYALSFDRDQESESDALGIRYMTRAGYNPIGSLEAMQVLADAAKGASLPPEFLSTHPHADTRVGRIRELLRSEHPGALSDPTANTFAERYRERMLRRLPGASASAGASAGDGETVTMSVVGERPRRMGVLALPDGAMERLREEARREHAVTGWCSLCAEEQDRAVREAISAD